MERTAEKPPEKFPEFLIDGILPANEVHLLGGSSGSGKTTFTFQVLLAEWQEGRSVLGHVSHPVPYTYISLDRSRSSVTRTLERLNLEAEIVRVVCQEEIPEESLTIDSVIKDCLKAHPDSKLIVIEGFQLLAGERGNGYTHVGKVLKKAARICSKQKLTIIGICHSPKMKVDESFKHPRETIMGSASWGAYSDTVITLDLNEQTGIITVHVMPRNAANEQHSFVFGERGKLVSLDSAKPKEALTLKIESLSEGRSVTRQEILEWADGLNLSRATADRVVTSCLRNKVLDTVSTGIYARTRRSPLKSVSNDDLIVVE